MATRQDTKKANTSPKNDRHPKKDEPENETFGNEPAIEDPKLPKQPSRYEVKADSGSDKTPGRTTRR